MMSVPPPAAEPTRMRTGFDGNVCALTWGMNASARMTIKRMLIFP